MPEAAMNENYSAMPREYDVRCSGKVLAVDAESVTHRVEERSDGNLGLRVLCPDFGHQCASAFLG